MPIGVEYRIPYAWPAPGTALAIALGIVAVIGAACWLIIRRARRNRNDDTRRGH
jgi:hypothetical protein